ncbi:MAG TPA: Stk1 family PASTA domain-containing Ser/Thr kinase [Gaiellaceae bacterium]|nr:Stk1 family PASTA domain-containing Ser/Thr kinase [Gaiellaceae bacterium]
MTDPLIDSLFDGRYRIVRKLGAGGMANVYLAEDQELGRRVAIKILNDRHANDDQFVERFRREAKNAAALTHPNIVSIYDRGEAEGTYYIAMEYLDGRSLKELIVSRGPAPVNVALEYARQILAALRFAHRHGIVHRDIKPHNVLVDGEGRLKVTDFGIARAGASQMTEVGSIVGTAQYLSPEQAHGSAVDQRSDLYSLGVVLYELLTGTAPFHGDTPVEIAMKHLSHAPEPPSALRPDVPQELDWVVMRALAKDPEERYQSAQEMDADLERVARGAPVAAATEDTATQIMRAPVAPPPAASAVAPGTAATMIAPRREAPPPPREYYDYGEPARRRSAWPWFLALLFVVAAGAGGWYVYHQLATSSVAKVPIGSYVNETQTQAADQIDQIGLVPNLKKQFSETVKKGLVIKQDPAEGSKVAKGGTVTIWVSQGKPTVEIPDLSGATRADALKQLRDLKLVPDPHLVPGGTAGQVTVTSPKAGKTVVEGTTVRVNISTGPPQVPVPKVVGETLSKATSDLRDLHFKVNVAAFKEDKAQANQVIAQKPPPGKSLPKGSTIDLTVSSGPPQVDVPDVVGESGFAAWQALHAAGLKMTTQPEDTTDPAQQGIVISQDPPGSTKADKGSTVTLMIGHYVPPTDTTPTTTDTTTTPTP